MGGHHHHSADTGTRRLAWAVAINMLLTVAQVVGGLLSGSLALIADALHNFSDAAGLLLALVARRISKRPADERRTFGYGRAEVVGGLINLFLFFGSCFFCAFVYSDPRFLCIFVHLCIGILYFCVFVYRDPVVLCICL